MPDTPTSNPIDIITFKILVEGTELPPEAVVIAIETESQIGRIPTAKVQIALNPGDGDDKTFTLSEAATYIPGKAIKIQLGYQAKEDTVFEGIIVSQAVRSAFNKPNVLELRCSDKAVAMTLGRKSKFFIDQKDSDICTALVGEHDGLSPEVDATTYQHKQITQAQCTDWDFLLMRAEANGLLAYAEAGTVKVKKPEASAAPELKVDFGQDILGFDLNMDARFQLNSTTTKSWDPKTAALLEKKSTEPSLATWGNIKGTTLAESVGTADEVLLSSSAFVNEELEAWANAKLMKSRLAAMQGSVKFFGNAKPKLNTLLELAGLGERFNGKALITRVHHYVRAGSWETTCGFGLSSNWHYEHADVKNPPADGLLGNISGLQIGVVKKLTEDPLNLNRIQVNVPGIDPAGEGLWARIATFYAGAEIGAFFMPEIGDEVILGFLNGDPSQPVIVGSMYSPNNSPAVTLEEENKIKSLVTKSKITIEFDEEKKILTFKTPGDNSIVLSDEGKGITLKDQNGNTITMDDKGITIKSSKDMTLDAQGKINLKSMADTIIKATGNLTGEGVNVEMKAKAKLALQGTAAAELKASGINTISGAMVKIN